MKKLRFLGIILAIVIGFSIETAAQTTKAVSCGQLSARIPTAWATSPSDLQGIGKILMMSDKEDNPSYIYSFTEYSMEVDDLDYALSSFVKNNQAVFYKGATFGPTKRIMLSGQQTLTLNFTNTFMGAKHLCSVYCTKYGKKTYVLLFMRKEGQQNIFYSVLNTIKFTAAADEKELNVREEITQMHNSMFPVAGQKRKVDDDFYLNNFDVSPTDDIVIYEYSMTDRDARTMTQADKNAFAQTLRSGMLGVLEEDRKNFKVLDRAIKAGYGVNITVKDRYDITMCTLKYRNSKFKK